MIVIKFGGHAMTDEHGSFAKAIADAISTGVTPVIVHGGGPQIGKALEAAGIESEFVGGFRVTTPQIFDVVEQVLANEVGPAVAKSLVTHGVSAVAGALDAEWLIVMTDVEGIYKNWPDKDSLITSISAKELESLKATFAQGMAPKVQACLDAIAAGAKAVRIIDGTNPSALKRALMGEGGTLVVA